MENHEIMLNRLTQLTDKWMPRIFWSVVGAAFLLSYVPLFQKATQAGYHWGLALLWPLLLDGVVVAALLSFVKRELRGDPTRYPFWLVIIFDGASILLNASYGGDWLSAIIHGLPPLALALMLKLYTNDIKDDYHRAAVVETLAGLRIQAEEVQARIEKLEPKKQALEADIKRLQSEKRSLTKVDRNEEKRPKGAQFSPRTIEKARVVYDELKKYWKDDRFGAELGRRIGISRRRGVELKRRFDEEAEQQAPQEPVQNHQNGKV